MGSARGGYVSRSSSCPGFLERLREVVRTCPLKSAVEIDGRVKWNYEGLWRESKVLTQRLRDRHVCPGDVVAIHSQDREHYVLGMLAAWHCGAIYFPVPGPRSSARTRSMIEWANPKVIVDDSQICGGEISCDRSCHDADLPSHAMPAYLCFTSGSSGRPKGVCVSDEGVVPMLDAQIAAFRITANSRCLWMLAPSFDASLSDVGTALLAGATVCVDRTIDQSRDFATTLDVIRSQSITHADLPPAVLSRLDERDCPGSLQTVVVGGEVSHPETIQRWSTRVRLINVYGPTEATVCTSLVRCDPRWELPSIGIPLPHVEYRIDEADTDQGELWIGGPAVALGYWRDKEETRTRFVTLDGHRFYRTGDQVRRLKNGQYEFQGRIDRQEQVHGHRFEPAEVEHALMTMDGIREAAVRIERHSDPPRILAWVAPQVSAPQVSGPQVSGPQVSIDETAILGQLASKLPRWMLPVRVFPVHELPRNTRGKVVLSRLAAPSPACADHWLLEELRKSLAQPELQLTDSVSAENIDSLTWLHLRGLAAKHRVSLDMCLFDGQRSIQEIATGTQLAVRTQEILEGVREDILPALKINTTERQRLTDARQGHEILLTGATGFLGGHVLQQLLDSTSHSVTCLVRAADAHTAKQRMLGNLSRLRLSIDPNRIQCVVGDITHPCFGLPEDEYQRMACAVDSVIHCAASVQMTQSLQQMMRTNAQGTANVVDFCCQANDKRLVYASTLAVLVDTDWPCGSIHSGDFPHLDHRVFGSYAQSKVAAEWIVQNARKEMGLKALCVRFPLLTAREGGPPPHQDILTLAIQGLLRVNAVPIGDFSDFQLNAIRVDGAAQRMISSLESDSFEAPSVFRDTLYPCIHEAAQTHASADQVFDDLANAHAGIDRLSMDQFVKRLGPSDPLRLIFRRILETSQSIDFEAMDLFRSSGYRFEDAVGPVESQWALESHLERWNQ